MNETQRFCIIRNALLYPNCKEFEIDADQGLLLLCRASQDIDKTAAVIKATAVNQDGKSSSLTAPNGPSQQSLIASCLATAGIPSAAVAYVAVHGTGTPLGDPIEVGALAGALAGKSGERRLPLSLGSVKVSWCHCSQIHRVVRPSCWLLPPPR